MDNCIFYKIVGGEVPSRKVFEDADIFAFHDAHPVAPVHFMLIPKLHIDSLSDVEDKHSNLLGKIMLLIPKLAKQQGCTDGFRTVINTGHVGGQEVRHLHVHVIGGGERLPAMVAHTR